MTFVIVKPCIIDLPATKMWGKEINITVSGTTETLLSINNRKEKKHE